MARLDRAIQRSCVRMSNRVCDRLDGLASVLRTQIQQLARKARRAGHDTESANHDDAQQSVFVQCIQHGVERQQNACMAIAVLCRAA